jgi:hypothetical protein
MTKRAIKAIRQAEGVDITNVKCLYCMDTRKCRHCRGAGSLWGPHGSLKLCEFCKGARKCQHCSKSVA